ncbi:hypothetical protein MKW94_008685 [Papaver nudicaule]|uniref:Major facilitator superfamily (MFS) profile domain-containing protein n=1 Tax=Papaver nudicaule TaxID=74823 RepID=A0AA41VCJ4_PAPNU|nr:hypothetical protein [Papaver nudicaule]
MAKPSGSEEISVVVESENTDSALGATKSDEEDSSPKKTSWCTPKWLLFLFCVINMLNYIDRGVIASTGVNGTRRVCNASGECIPGKGIQGAFNLTNFQDGVLSSAFMVGLLIASPIFAFLAKRHNPFRLIGVGLLVWTLATAGCGGTFNFWSIAVCRMLVGVGEASFISLAAPFIDDNAPAAKKTFWLALFYMCIPVGIATGYEYGGLVAGHLGWRYAFFGEAIVMLPFTLLCFIMKPLQLKGFAPNEATSVQTVVLEVCEVIITEVPDQAKDAVNISSGEGQSNKKTSEKKTPLSKRAINQISRIWKDLKVLLLDKVYVVNVLGYVAYTFVIGAYSYWGPTAGADIYKMTNADMVFGGITLLCGVFGTLAGGYLLDRVTSTIRNGFILLAAATILGGICCFAAFCFKSMFGFIPFFALGLLILFAAQAPVNFVCLHCVRPSLRPISMAISTVAIHLLGDVPSSPLVGVLQDHIHSWRKTALILTSIFVIAAAIWFGGIFLHSVDRYSEEDNATEPLAGENTVERLDHHPQVSES